jgi:hypothetical protein
LIAKTIDQDDASAYYNVYRNNKMIDEKSSVEIKTGWSVELQDRNNTSHPYNVGKQIGREMGAYLKLADSRGVRYLM